MINKVKIKLRNCYGIRSLDHEFDFSNNNMPVVVYSPNGTMKTSLAKTIQDLSEGKDSTDRIYPDRETIREIQDQEANDISSENVFVIQSYDKGYKSDRISSLLVNSDLKGEYDKIFQDIGEKKDSLLRALKKVSGLTKPQDIENELAGAFNKSPKELLVALGRVQREVKKFKNPDFATVKYKSIFTPRILSFLENDEFRHNLVEYTAVYDSLIEKSSYFKKGIFNHNNAATIAKNLKTNGWFDGGHTVSLKSVGEIVEVSTQDELESIIQKEKDTILDDDDLKKSFEKIDNALSNAELKTFRDFLVSNTFIIPELTDIARLKETIWIAYLKEAEAVYEELMGVYDEGEERIIAIIDAAKIEATKWREVIKIFNERFSVPFIVNMDNQDDVILGIDSPQISFDFQSHDEEERKPIDEDDLQEYLSNGERRALYLLNIIFEVEARKETGIETVFVADDIADSFDYKNKYAIIEYLNDIRKSENFHLIVLTHNFDFYRTVKGRLRVFGENKLHSVKSNSEVALVKDQYDESPFLSWRKNLSDISIFIASVPFIRNLAEYTGDGDSFDKLTALLHIKNNTENITIGEVANLYRQVLHNSVSFEGPDNDAIFLDKLFECCEVIVSSHDEAISLERKIILAIGIRLKAEKYIISNIQEDEWVSTIRKNQTSKLIKKFKEKCSDKTDGIDFVEKVNLMTPENIHLNSFMFEPIMDMADDHLKRLYSFAKILLGQ